MKGLNTLKAVVAATALTAVPAGESIAQQSHTERPKITAAAPKQKPERLGQAVDLSELKKQFPELAKKWAAISPLHKRQPWGYSFAMNNKLGNSSEAQAFLSELHKELSGAVTLAYFGQKYDLHDLAFAQIAGKSGWTVSNKSRSILGSLAKAGPAAGLSFDTAFERDDKDLRDLLGLRVHEQKSNLSQLSYAYAALSVGPYRSYLKEGLDDFLGPKPMKRMVVPHGQRVSQGGIIETGERALNEEELKTYLATGEPMNAKPQFLFEEDGKSRWITDEDAFVPRDLTYDFEHSQLAPYSFTDTFPSKGQKAMGFSPSLALTVGYLQSVLHDYARNIPENKGRGWSVTGNISPQFLNNLKVAIDLVKSDTREEDHAVLRDILIKQIAEKEILPSITGIEMKGIAKAEDLFETLSDFLHLSFKQPIRSDFEVDLTNYQNRDGRHLRADQESVWSALHDRPIGKEQIELLDSLSMNVDARPKEDSEARYTKRYNGKGFEVAVPAHVRELALQQERKIEHYAQTKSLIEDGVRELAKQKLGQFEASTGPIIPLNSILPEVRRTVLHGSKVSGDMGGGSQLEVDDRPWKERWFGKDPAQEFSYDRDSGAIVVSPDARKGTHRVSMYFTVELPEPPLGSSFYSGYHNTERPRDRYRSFHNDIVVHVR